jgi:dATP/dGTP diphosphohydrolase
MSEHFITKDSGEREEFRTGAKRDVREGKGRYDLISTFGLKRLALLYERGCIKYGPNNWTKGMPFMRVLDSLLRHANQYLQGEPIEDHLAAIAWNAFALIHYEEMIKLGLLPKELDDRPCYKVKSNDSILKAVQQAWEDAKQYHQPMTLDDLQRLSQIKREEDHLDEGECSVEY